MLDAGDMVLTLTDQQTIRCELAIVQIGFLSVKETFERVVPL